MAAASSHAADLQMLPDFKTTRFFIGKGGFGVVHGRYSKSTGRLLAVKEIKRRKPTDHSAQIEIRNMNMFRHERIIKLVVCFSKILVYNFR
jgi:serine/threonine protein kinase